MAKTNETSTIIDGIAAAETVDSSGQVLNVKGCDISSLKNGTGILNWEHSTAPVPNKVDSPRSTIGKIVFAKKIFTAKDCDNDRERFFWNKVKVPLVYIKARLFDGSGHPDAIAAAASFRDAVTHGEAPTINFSIEGHTIEQEGNKLQKSFARAVAATQKPCNKAAVASVLYDPVTGHNNIKDVEEKSADLLSNLVEKNEVPGRQVLSSVPIDYDPIVKEEDARVNLKIAVHNLVKALEAGSYNAAPGSLSGGACLQREDLKKVGKDFWKNQVKGAVRDYDRYSGKTFREFLKSRLPEVDDDFLDYFADAVNDFEFKKSENYRVRKLEHLALTMLSKAVRMNTQGFAEQAKTGAPGAVQSQSITVPPLKDSAPTKNPFETGLETPARAADNAYRNAALQPRFVDGHLHGAAHLKLHDEQHAMIHGLDVSHNNRAGSIARPGVSSSRRVKLPTGEHGIVKDALTGSESPTHAPSSAHAETIYHNAAKHFFGMGQYVPTTSYFQDPQYGAPGSVMKAIPNAEHVNRTRPDHQAILAAHGDSGELDKMALMDSIMGNSDRHGGNYMMDGKQIHLIDHGHALDYSDKDLTKRSENYYPVSQPSYLQDYHRNKTGSHEQKDHHGIKLHPDAANWVMGFSPQNLTSFMRSQGLPGNTAREAGRRLSVIQHTIQQKGMDTGTWEAYNAPYGQNSYIGHKLRGVPTPAEQYAEDRLKSADARDKANEARWAQEEQVRQQAIAAFKQQQGAVQ